jgi:PAS domain S-box-containing protein
MDDRIDGVVLTFQDITGRREAELQVRRSEERLRLLIDSVIDYALFTMSDDGLIDSWNAGAERMFGYTADDILGRSVDILFTPEDRRAGVPAAERDRARADGRASDERRQVRKDGTVFHCTGVTTALGDRGGLGFARVARDLSASRLAADALRDAVAQTDARVRQRTTELEAEVVKRLTAQTDLENLLRKIVTAQEDERARIARDLHDQLGQQLTALRLTLEQHLQRLAAEGGPAHDVERALALAREIDREVDFLAGELRPAMLDDLGLAAALPRYLQQWSGHYGIRGEFRGASFTAGDLPRDAELVFYRVAQEALNNILKHAHASRVDVMLETRDGRVVLIVEDDGLGFDLDALRANAGGIGLAGMRERAASVGATLQIESGPGEGTSIYLRCPAAAAAG